MSKLLKDYFDDEDDYYYDDYDEVNEDFYLSEQKKQNLQTIEDSFNVFEVAEKQEKLRTETKSNRIKKSTKNTKNLLIQYENQIENIKEEEKKKKILEKVHYTFDITQCVQTSLNAIGFNSVVLVSTNPKFEKKHYEIFGRNQTLVALMSNGFVDESGIRIPQLIYTPLKNLSCLRRQFHAQCTVGHWIILHGGINNNNVFLFEIQF